MTELAFHFGAPNKLAYACRLVRKAVVSGARVVVVADADSISQLDADLWGVSATDFVPHCLNTAPEPVKRRSPVWLATDLAEISDGYAVLVNLADTVPHGFERFSRVVEVVSTDMPDRDSARGRWRFYTQQGYAIQRHDLNLKRTD